MKRKGERGHLIEEKVSQSADPHLPRAIVWDELTGFSLSYNGGGPKQTAKDRLDILSFDSSTKKFQLSAVDFVHTEETIKNNIDLGKVYKSKTCFECHGPDERPIFSMYPDWPSFYGSDNDELNNPSVEVQKIELKDYRNFLNTTVKTNSRFSPLFDDKIPKNLYGLKIWETYPYRMDTSTEAKNISRSFTFRPALRLGILYNRQIAQSIFNKMRYHSNYNQLKGLVLHSLLQCDWNSSYPKTKELIKESLKSTPLVFHRTDHLQLEYNSMLSIFDLKINDIDIRFSYNHKGYNYTDVNVRKNIMHPGYIDKYFNSYFDGTATIDELLAAQMISEMATSYGGSFINLKLRGLTEKYKHLAARYQFDKNSFAHFDQLGLWFPIPYPKELYLTHHRETYTDDLKLEYQKACQATTEYLKKQFVN
jgi:hypothetical protein